MQTLEDLLLEFLVRLRHDLIFDDELWTRVKLELSSFLLSTQQETSVPKKFASLIMNAVMVLGSQAETAWQAERREKIYPAQEQLASLVDQYCSE